MAEKIRVKTRTEERILRITYEEGSPTPLMYEDMGEIVRCKDCEHSTGIPEQLVCKMPCGDATASRAWCHPDGFCAWGERKDNGD